MGPSPVLAPRVKLEKKYGVKRSVSDASGRPMGPSPVLAPRVKLEKKTVLNVAFLMNMGGIWAQWWRHLGPSPVLAPRHSPFPGLVGAQTGKINSVKKGIPIRILFPSLIFLV